MLVVKRDLSIQCVTLPEGADGNQTCFSLFWYLQAPKATMSTEDLADVVDLTDSPAPEQPASKSTKASKRHREDTEIMDVVSREEIMSFAAKANQRKRVTSPLSDSTGQLENARQEPSGRPDNLWLKQLHAERTARQGVPSTSDEAPADPPQSAAAHGSKAGPSGRHHKSAQAADRQPRNVTLLTWNVWCVENSMHRALVCMCLAKNYLR